MSSALAVVQGVREPAENVVAADFEREQSLEELSDDSPDHSSEDSPWEISDSEGSDVIMSQKGEVGSQVSAFLAGLRPTKNLPKPIASGARKPTMELPYLLSEINFVISCLYKLPSRNPAPLDRFVGQALADMPLYQHFDILYVKDKFPSTNPILATRLGKLITRRRQLLASRSAHDRRLMSSNVTVEESSSDLRSEPNRPTVSDSNDVQDPSGSTNKKTSRSQLSSIRQSTFTKATLIREKARSEDKQKNLIIDNVSEYAPSMASSHAAKL